MKPAVMLLIAVALTSGCATEYNLRRDLVTVRPSGTLTIFNSGTNQVALLDGRACPPQFTPSTFSDRFGTRVPLDSTNYVCRLTTYGQLWISGTTSNHRSAPILDWIDDLVIDKSLIPTNAVVLRMTHAEVRRYTPLSLARKIATTPFMLCYDIVSLGMSAWVYADNDMEIAGRYEFTAPIVTNQDVAGPVIVPPTTLIPRDRRPGNRRGMGNSTQLTILPNLMARLQETDGPIQLTYEEAARLVDTLGEEQATFFSRQMDPTCYAALDTSRTLTVFKKAQNGILYTALRYDSDGYLLAKTYGTINDSYWTSLFPATPKPNDPPNTH